MLKRYLRKELKESIKHFKFDLRVYKRINDCQANIKESLEEFIYNHEDLKESDINDLKDYIKNYEITNKDIKEIDQYMKEI